MLNDKILVIDDKVKHFYKYPFNAFFLNTIIASLLVGSSLKHTIQAQPSVYTGSGRYTLFLKSNGELWASGQNYYGQFGNGESENTYKTPQLIASNVIEACGGEGHIVYLDQNGKLFASGLNASGQLGDASGTTRNYFSALELNNATRVFASEKSTFWLTDQNVLWGVGYNHFGQLGNGSINSSEYNPIEISNGVEDFTGKLRTSFYLKNGNLYAMGSNQYNLVAGGYNTKNRTSVPEQLAISSDKKFNSIDSLSSSAYFLSDDGSLWASGNYIKEWPETRETLNLEMIFSSGVVSISAGDDHLLYSKSDGSVWGIGSNSNGQLTGDRNTDFYMEGVKIFDSGIRSFYAGMGRSFVIKDDGSFWGIGANSNGELGIDSLLDQYEYVKILDDSKAQDSGESVTSLSINPNETWGWFKWPWVYINKSEDWCYFHNTDDGYFLYSNNNRSWFKWISLTDTWELHQ